MHSKREVLTIMTSATRPRAGAAILALVLLAALAAGTAGAPAPVRAEGDDTWVPVSLLYHSDVKGKIEPCG
jgi:hypothetical protein